jgi:hypothetical protein
MREAHAAWRERRCEGDQHVPGEAKRREDEKTPAICQGAIAWVLRYQIQENGE